MRDAIQITSAVALVLAGYSGVSRMMTPVPVADRPAAQTLKIEPEAAAAPIVYPFGPDLSQWPIVAEQPPPPIADRPQPQKPEDVHPAQEVAKPPVMPKPERLPWSTDLDSAWRTAKRLNRRVVAVFSGPGCQPCEFLKQNVYGHADVIGPLGLKFVPVKLEADDKGNAGGIRIYRVPAIAILSPDGARPVWLKPAVYFDDAARTRREFVELVSPNPESS